MKIKSLNIAFAHAINLYIGLSVTMGANKLLRSILFYFSFCCLCFLHTFSDKINEINLPWKDHSFIAIFQSYLKKSEVPL